VSNVPAQLGPVEAEGVNSGCNRLPLLSGSADPHVLHALMYTLRSVFRQKVYAVNKPICSVDTTSNTEQREYIFTFFCAYIACYIEDQSHAISFPKK
jgi:hypothetical protein